MAKATLQSVFNNCYLVLDRSLVGGFECHLEGITSLRPTEWTSDIEYLRLVITGASAPITVSDIAVVADGSTYKSVNFQITGLSLNTTYTMATAATCQVKLVGASDYESDTYRPRHPDSTGTRFITASFTGTTGAFTVSIATDYQEVEVSTTGVSGSIVYNLYKQDGTLVESVTSAETSYTFSALSETTYYATVTALSTTITSSTATTPTPTLTATYTSGYTKIVYNSTTTVAGSYKVRYSIGGDQSMGEYVYSGLSPNTTIGNVTITLCDYLDGVITPTSVSQTLTNIATNSFSLTWNNSTSYQTITLGISSMTSGTFIGDFTIAGRTIHDTVTSGWTTTLTTIPSNATYSLTGTITADDESWAIASLSLTTLQPTAALTYTATQATLVVAATAPPVGSFKYSYHWDSETESEPIDWTAAITQSKTVRVHSTHQFYLSIYDSWDTSRIVNTVSLSGTSLNITNLSLTADTIKVFSASGATSFSYIDGSYEIIYIIDGTAGSRVSPSTRFSITSLPATVHSVTVDVYEAGYNDILDTKSVTLTTLAFGSLVSAMTTPHTGTLSLTLNEPGYDYTNFTVDYTIAFDDTTLASATKTVTENWQSSSYIPLISGGHSYTAAAVVKRSGTTIATLNSNYDAMSYAGYGATLMVAAPEDLTMDGSWVSLPTEVAQTINYTISAPSLAEITTSSTSPAGSSTSSFSVDVLKYATTFTNSYEVIWDSYTVMTGSLSTTTPVGASVPSDRSVNSITVWLGNAKSASKTVKWYLNGVLTATETIDVTDEHPGEYTFTSLTPDTSYTIAMELLNNSSQILYSTTATLSTLPITFHLTTSNVTCENVTLALDHISAGTGTYYVTYYWQQYNNPTVNGTSPIYTLMNNAVSSHTFTGLNANTKYLVKGSIYADSSATTLIDSRQAIITTLEIGALNVVVINEHSVNFNIYNYPISAAAYTVNYSISYDGTVYKTATNQAISAIWNATDLKPWAVGTHTHIIQADILNSSSVIVATLTKSFNPAHYTVSTVSEQNGRSLKFAFSGLPSAYEQTIDYSLVLESTTVTGTLTIPIGSSKSAYCEYSGSTYNLQFEHGYTVNYQVYEDGVQMYCATSATVYTHGAGTLDIVPHYDGAYVEIVGDLDADVDQMGWQLSTEASPHIVDCGSISPYATYTYTGLTANTTYTLYTIAYINSVEVSRKTSTFTTLSTSAKLNASLVRQTTARLGMSNLALSSDNYYVIYTCGSYVSGRLYITNNVAPTVDLSSLTYNTTYNATAYIYSSLDGTQVLTASTSFTTLTAFSFASDVDTNTITARIVDCDYAAAATYSYTLKTSGGTVIETSPTYTKLANSTATTPYTFTGLTAATAYKITVSYVIGSTDYGVTYDVSTWDYGVIAAGYDQELGVIDMQVREMESGSTRTVTFTVKDNSGSIIYTTTVTTTTGQTGVYHTGTVTVNARYTVTADITETGKTLTEIVETRLRSYSAEIYQSGDRIAITVQNLDATIQYYTNYYIYYDGSIIDQRVNAAIPLGSTSTPIWRSSNSLLAGNNYVVHVDLLVNGSTVYTTESIITFNFPIEMKVYRYTGYFTVLVNLDNADSPYDVTLTNATTGWTQTNYLTAGNRTTTFTVDDISIESPNVLTVSVVVDGQLVGTYSASYDGLGAPYISSLQDDGAIGQISSCLLNIPANITQLTWTIYRNNVTYHAATTQTITAGTSQSPKYFWAYEDGYTYTVHCDLNDGSAYEGTITPQSGLGEIEAVAVGNTITVKIVGCPYDNCEYDVSLWDKDSVEQIKPITHITNGTAAETPTITWSGLNLGQQYTIRVSSSYNGNYYGTQTEPISIAGGSELYYEYSGTSLKLWLKNPNSKAGSVQYLVSGYSISNALTFLSSDYYTSVYQVDDVDITTSQTIQAFITYTDHTTEELGMVVSATHNDLLYSYWIERDFIIFDYQYSGTGSHIKIELFDNSGNRVRNVTRTITEADEIGFYNLEDGMYSFSLSVLYNTTVLNTYTNTFFIMTKAPQLRAEIHGTILSYYIDELWPSYTYTAYYTIVEADGTQSALPTVTTQYQTQSQTSTYTCAENTTYTLIAEIAFGANESVRYTYEFKSSYAIFDNTRLFVQRLTNSSFYAYISGIDSLATYVVGYSVYQNGQLITSTVKSKSDYSGSPTEVFNGLSAGTYQVTAYVLSDSKQLYFEDEIDLSEDDEVWNVIVMPGSAKIWIQSDLNYRVVWTATPNRNFLTQTGTMTTTDIDAAATLTTEPATTYYLVGKLYSGSTYIKSINGEFVSSDYALISGTDVSATTATSMLTNFVNPYSGSYKVIFDIIDEDDDLTTYQRSLIYDVSGSILYHSWTDLTADTIYKIGAEIYDSNMVFLQKIRTEIVTTVAKPALWSWTSANGPYASTAETIAAKSALDGGGRCNQFNGRVWNDLTYKVQRMIFWANQNGIPDMWRTQYDTANKTYITYNNGFAITSKRFRAVWFQIQNHVELLGCAFDDCAVGQPIRGSYFTNLTDALNSWISGDAKPIVDAMDIYMLQMAVRWQIKYTVNDTTMRSLNTARDAAIDAGTINGTKMTIPDDDTLGTLESYLIRVYGENTEN